MVPGVLIALGVVASVATQSWVFVALAFACAGLYELARRAGSGPTSSRRPSDSYRDGW